MSVLAIEVGEGASAARVSQTLDAAAGAGAWDAIGRHAEPGLALGVRTRALGPEDERHGGVAVDEARGLVVAWDGRIDDRAAICRALALEPGAPSACVALEAFSRWAERAPEHLLGDFAFVVYTRRDRALFVARDRVGVRPLYALALPSGVVRLSTSERALFACGDADERPNLPVLASALAGAAVLKTETLRAGVEVIPAASTVWLRAGGRAARAYYRPDPSAVDAKTSRQGHVERVSAALELAVADRIRSTSRIAAQASGGLDSSSVAAIAAAQLAATGREPPLLLHMRCAGLTCDEGRYARSLAAKLGAPLVEADGSAAAYRPWPSLEIDLGGPWCDVYRQLYRAAAAAGARVVLTGEGSDELQLRHGLEIEDALVRRSALEAARFAGLFDDPLSRRGWARLARAAARRAAPRTLRARLERRAEREEPPAFLTTAARGWARQGLERLADERRSIEHESPLRRAVCVELTSTVGMTLILQEIQAFASHHGLELTHPFLDLRVIEAFHALPTSLRTSFDTIKPTLRAAMEGRLPPAVLWRAPPTDYTEFHDRAWRAPRAEWLELAGSSRLAALGLVEPGAFKAAIEAGFSGELTSEVTNALELEGWLRRSNLSG